MCVNVVFNVDQRIVSYNNVIRVDFDPKLNQIKLFKKNYLSPLCISIDIIDECLIYRDDLD